jgi:AraC-like DNA-binding protein
MKQMPAMIRRNRNSGDSPFFKEILGLEKPGIVTRHGGVNKSLDFLAKNFNRPIQLKDLAKVSGLSRRGFNSAFEKQTGEYPGAVLRRIRLEYAKRLLTEQDMTLTEIARKCGYRSQNTFCVAFQRTVGISPKKFQRAFLLQICRLQRQWQVQPVSASCSFPPALNRIFDRPFDGSRNNPKALWVG